MNRLAWGSALLAATALPANLSADSISGPADVRQRLPVHGHAVTSGRRPDYR